MFLQVYSERYNELCAKQRAGLEKTPREDLTGDELVLKAALEKVVLRQQQTQADAKRARQMPDRERDDFLAGLPESTVAKQVERGREGQRV